MNTLKQKLIARERVIGWIQVTASADVTEVLAGAGFDFVMIDHEHGLGGLSELISQLRALKGTGTAALVRVPSHDASYARRLLDAGVLNILFPGVESAEAARAAVHACRYPPHGSRGAGGSLRATDYDRDFGYYERAMDDTLVGIQVESARGIAALDEILAVEGIDLIVIGPRDVSASIGKLNRFDDEEVKALCATAEQRIRSSRVAFGSVIYPGLTAREMFERGHQLILAGSDVAFLTRSAKEALGAIKGA